MKRIKTQGVNIPRLGFGTFRMPGNESQPVVESAIALGFRHIDTAAMYENETAVGTAIAASGVKREELFVATKVWHDQLAPFALDRAFEVSLGKLKLDYVDLYMIHWPNRDMDMAATMEAMIELRERGLTRAIGVCNFNLPMIRRAVDEIGAPIAVPSSRVPSLPVAGAYAGLSAQQGDSADRLRAARARPGGKRRHARCHRPQTWRDRGADSYRLAVGPTGRHRDPQGRPAGKPESQSRRARHYPRRRRSRRDRSAAEGQALRPAAIRTGVGCRRVSVPNLRAQLLCAATAVLACKLAMSRAAANVPKAMSPH